MSAAEVSGKPARIARKAANSMVVSSETRNTAMLAIQNTGQGERPALTGTGACTRRVEAGMARSLADRLQVHRRLRRQAAMDLPCRLVGQHLAEAGFQPVQRDLHDAGGRQLGHVEA